MRKAEISRKTNETDIKVYLDIDGTGKYEINTGSGFLNHMLELFAKHGRFDLKVICKGDKEVDFHHSTEDIGIVLGKCFKEALGDKKGINRYADVLMPMDEALVSVAVDVSGRSYLVFNADMPAEKVGAFDTELVREFFEAFTRECGITLHINLMYGNNTHHIIESIFKGVSRCLNIAVKINDEIKDEIPSTKGVL